MQPFAAGLAALICAGGVTAVFAADPAVDELRGRVEQLEKLVEQQAALIEELQRKQGAPSEPASAAASTTTAPPAIETTAVPAIATVPAAIGTATVPAPVAVPSTESATVTLANGRPTITSADGSSSVSLRGRVFADFAHYRQDSAGPLSSDFRRGSIGGPGNRETYSAQDLSSGVNFRRATIGIDGRFANDWSYRFLYEFGGSGSEGPARINEAWIMYGGFDFGNVQFGAFSPPSNLEDSTSIEDSLFLERATPAELSRALGAGEGRYAFGVRHVRERWLAALHLTGANVREPEIYDEQLAIVGRVGGLVATTDDYNVHLGVNGTWVFDTPDTLGANQPGVRRAIRFRDRPELRVDGTRLIDTGAIDADAAYNYGLEAAANWRNFFVQAEHFWYGAERRAGLVGGDPRFDAWYVQGSWVITGERRRYNTRTASWQQPQPARAFSLDSGDWGAFEAAARYSLTDLNWNTGDPLGLAPAGGIRGGEQRIFTLGLNWYPNAIVKFMLDYMRVEVDRMNPVAVGNASPFGAAPLTPPAGVYVGQDLDVVSGSIRVAF